MPNCMADDGEKAVFVGTFLTNGESVALCDEHMVYFCASTLQDMTGVDPAPFIAAISDDDELTETEVEEVAREIPGAERFYGSEPPDEIPADAPQMAPVASNGTAPDPTPPTPKSGRLRAVSSAAPTAGADKSDTTTAEAGTATSAQ